MDKFARKFFGESYKCRKNWEADTFVQCGDSGVVLSKKRSYRTAFFEAFSKNPDVFVRGEGKTIIQAEKACWEKLQTYKKCKNHEFERHGYRNGGGFCKHCGMFKGKAFEPLEKCIVCGKPTYYTQDKNDDWYCEKHPIPQKLKSEHMIRHEKSMKAFEKFKKKPKKEQEKIFKKTFKAMEKAFSEKDNEEKTS